MVPGGLPRPGSPWRDFYVWSAEKPADADQGMVFPGVQETTWTWNEQVEAYYFHRFFSHQPDLNIANPAVRQEILRIMGSGPGSGSRASGSTPPCS